MVLNKIPSFQEVKDWVNANTATSVNGETGDVILDATQPITKQNGAETFEESDVSVDGTDIVAGGSVFIAANQSSASYPQNTTIGFDDGGLRFNPNQPINAVSYQIYSGVYSGNIELREVSTGELLGQKSGGSGTFVEPMEPGTEYEIKAMGSTDVKRNGDATFPVTTALADVTNGAYLGGGAGYWMAIKSLTFHGGGTSGQALISWPRPNDIYRWDAATFNADPDGETVDVYIEESTDGGSTWTEIAGPISRGQEITADPASEVRFRVELSRSDTANNPALDSIHRRWEV